MAAGKRIPATPSQWVFAERALGVAAVYCGSRPSEMRDDVRFRQYVWARWAVMRALHRRYPSLALREIGRLVSRDHSSVQHGLTRGDYFYERDPAFAELCDMVAAA